MSQRIGNVVLIEVEEDSVCELCGKVDELRPYGPKGERICFSCGEKDKEGTERKLKEVLFGIVEH